MGKNLEGKEIGKGIRQLPNGKYSARYNDRFGVRKTLYGWNLQELKRKLNNAIYDEQNNEALVNESITLSEWYQIWLEVHKYKVIGPNTKRHYEYIFNKIIRPILGSKRLCCKRYTIFHS